MYRFSILLCIIILISACQTTGKRPASFDNPDITNVGIVFMHGKGGGPSYWIPGIVQELRAAGYIVISPRMPWAGGRYGMIYSAKAEKLIDGYIKDLKSAGAEIIILGGHSAGGAGAIVYAAKHDGINGVMLVGPPATVPEESYNLNAPILWVRGRGDSTALSSYHSAEYKDVPEHPLNQRTLVNADHKDTPDSAKHIAVDWVKKVVEEYRKTSI